MPNSASSKKSSRHFLRLTTLSLAVLIAILGLGNLIASNILATQGAQLNQLLTQTENLAKDNQHLANQLGQLQSLTRVETQATDRGFIRTQHSLNLTSLQPVAQAR